MKKPVKGAFLAAAVAGLFVASAASADHHGDAKKGEEMVKCKGVNECKGKSDCHTAKSSCAGHNECKGKGWKKMTKAECEEKGGTVAEKKKDKKG
jgi:hypothetical protein